MGQVAISRSLNLVIPVEREGGDLQVFATALPQPVFEEYHLVIASTFAAIYNAGLSHVAGPRVASLMLKETAKSMKWWEGEGGVEQGLMPEIERNVNILAPGAGGYEMIPLAEALARNLLDDEEAFEVQNAIVFFMLASAMHNRKDRRPIVEGAARIWGGQISSSPLTEFMNSLKTSTPGDNTGAKGPASSIPG